MLATLILLASTVAAADKPEENIYKEAKVGDWSEFKSINAFKETVTNKQTVIAKTADDATIRIEQSLNGKASPPIEYKASLKPRPDPKDDPTIAKDVTTETVKLDSGKETITVAGKSFDCEWEKNKTTMTFTPKDPKKKPKVSITVMKRWASKDVPLGGMVKMEVESDGKTMTTELVGYGRGP
jgi:hypothetical protein